MSDKPHQYSEEEIAQLKLTDPKNAKACQHVGWWCDYVAPYDFVPEAGCPIHD